MPLSGDLALAARGLRKSPALSFIAIASFALGIGANVTIYSVVREMIFDDITSIGTLPFMGELPRSPIRRKGDPLSAARDAYNVGAGEQFCKVLGIPILRGRDFEIADRSRQPVPILVNQTLALELFGDADPIGAQLLAGRDQERVLRNHRRNRRRKDAHAGRGSRSRLLHAVRRFATASFV